MLHAAALLYDTYGIGSDKIQAAGPVQIYGGNPNVIYLVIHNNGEILPL